MSLLLKKILLATALVTVVVGQFVRVNTTMVEADSTVYPTMAAQQEFITIPVDANEREISAALAVETDSINSKIDSLYADPEKVRKVEAYLNKRGSPLAAHSQHIVKMATMYGVDYRLIPAISIIESSGCIHMFRTYNCWGWGKMNFSSFDEGVTVVTAGMAKYYANGATTPHAMQRSYCPPCTTWGDKVTGVMNEIERM